MLKIVTDGAADMPPGWKEEFDIDIIPLMVRFGEEAFFEGINIDKAGFYRKVKETGIIPKTSLPSPDQVMVFYRKAARKGDEILSIHIASKLSGTYNTVQLAARQLSDEINIHTFDSAAGSAAMGFMCREARLLARAGASLQDIFRRLEAIREKISVIFTLDTLEFAYKSGRVSAIQSTLGALLNVKPIIVLRDGLLEMEGKVRTRQRSLEHVLKIISERVGNQSVNIAVVHADDPAAAKTMFDRVRESFNCRLAVITDLAIPVAANLGPGTIGIVAYPVED